MLTFSGKLYDEGDSRRHGGWAVRDTRKYCLLTNQEYICFLKVVEFSFLYVWKNINKNKMDIILFTRQKDLKLL